MTDLSLHQEKPLKTRIWITRGCYFNMAERLRRKGRFSVGSTSALSLYVIAVSIYLAIPMPQHSSDRTTWLSITTLCLSIAILVITNLEAAKNYTVEALRAQEKAQTISKLFNAYETSAASSVPNADEVRFSQEYSDLLANSSDITRKPIDYYLFQFNNRRFPEFAFTNWDKIQIFLALIYNGCTEYWLYAVMVVGPPLALLWWLFH